MRKLDNAILFTFTAISFFISASGSSVNASANANSAGNE